MKRVVAVLAVLASFSAFAQMDKQEPPPPAPDIKRDHKFGGAGVDGMTEAPDVPVELGRPHFTFKSLLTVRANFQRELQKSVEGVK